jgi:hypothetical protein
MQQATMNKLQTGLVWAGLAGLSLLLLNSPGTSDMGIWLSWSDNLDRLGLVRGFAANHADYPPLTSAILLGAVRLFEMVDVRPFVAIKLSIGVFLSLTTLVFWRWTKDLTASVGLFLALTLNSLLLAYVDIYYAPALLLGWWALKRGRMALFSICFTAACLTKWQPLIIAPFLLVYALARQEPTAGKHEKLARLALPPVIMGAVALLIFGLPPVWEALRASFSHAYLSGNALNFNWILTHLLRVFSPEKFGGLVDGRADYIVTAEAGITLWPRLVFGLFYAASLVIFIWRREKTFANTLHFALLGFLAYFTFNVGVHENHLFVAALLAAALAWLEPGRRLEMLVVTLIFNINMYTFYGSSGPGLAFDRVIFHRVDMALPLACFNVVFFLYLFAREWMTNGEEKMRRFRDRRQAAP